MAHEKTINIEILDTASSPEYLYQEPQEQIIEIKESSKLKISKGEETTRINILAKANNFMDDPPIDNNNPLETGITRHVNRG
jgi:hypothetical protein